MCKPVLLLLLLSLACRACDVGWQGDSSMQVVDEREFFGEYLEINWAKLVRDIQCVESVVVELTLNRDGNLGGSSKRSERQARHLRGDPIAMENLFQYTDCQEAPYIVNVTIIDKVGVKFVHRTTLDPLKLFDSKQIVVKHTAGNPVVKVLWLENVFKDLRLREHCLRGGKLFKRNVLEQELDIMYPEVEVTSRSCKEEIFSIQYDIGENPKTIFFAIPATENCTNMDEGSTTSATKILKQRDDTDQLMSMGQHEQDEDLVLESEKLLQAGLPIFGIASCSAMVVIIVSLVGLIVFVRMKKKREEININSILYRPQQSYNSSEDRGSYGRYTTRGDGDHEEEEDGVGQQSFHSSSTSHQSQERDEVEEEFVGDVIAIVDNIPYYRVGPIEVTEL